MSIVGYLVNDYLCSKIDYLFFVVGFGELKPVDKSRVLLSLVNLALVNCREINFIVIG